MNLKIVAAFLLLLCSAFATPAPAAKPEYRMLWVDVFHPGFRTAAEIDTMIQAARLGNYNAIVVQARKASDAFYNSNVEPKNNAISPDFDPLGYAIRRAHDTSGGQQRLEVHVWFVTYRVRIPSDETYKNPRHVYNQHPEWLSQKYDGKKEGSGENSGRFYLDPGVPQVIDYNLQVVADLLTNYDVDGIIYDYIRYPEAEGGSSASTWGYNPIAVQRFNTLYGRTGKPSPTDPQWGEFRREQINNFMRKVYAHVRLWRPNVKVGAAAIGWGAIDKGFEMSSAYQTIFQDWPLMAQNGFLDIISPMNYKREAVAAQAADHRPWAQFLGQVAQQSGRLGVNMVDGETLNSLSGVLAQVSATRNMPGISGIGTYAYAETRKEIPRVPDTEFFQTMRTKFFTSPAPVPTATWLTRPSQGMVKGIITRNGKPWDGALVQVAGRGATTDGTGFYAIARIQPGQYQLTVSDGRVTAATKAVEVRAGGVAEAAISIR